MWDPPGPSGTQFENGSDNHDIRTSPSTFRGAALDGEALDLYMPRRARLRQVDRLLLNHTHHVVDDTVGGEPHQTALLREVHQLSRSLALSVVSSCRKKKNDITDPGRPPPQKVVKKFKKVFS
jgi:hypothetical protein